MKGRADLSRLNDKKGGIPKTAANKNREAMLVIDRSRYATLDDLDIDVWFEDAMVDLINNKIDTIIITVKDRTMRVLNI